MFDYEEHRKLGKAGEALEVAIGKVATAADWLNGLEAHAAAREELEAIADRLRELARPFDPTTLIERQNAEYAAEEAAEAAGATVPAGNDDPFDFDSELPDL